MKTFGLCFIPLSAVLAVSASAQQLTSIPLSNTEDAPARKLLARGTQIRLPHAGYENDNLILSQDDREPACAFMRTYRVKREDRDSDATRSASYTKCVPIERFAIKRAIEPRDAPSE